MLVRSSTIVEYDSGCITWACFCMRFQRDIPILDLQGNETFKCSGVGM